MTEHHPAGMTLKQAFVHFHFHPALISRQEKNHLQNILKNYIQFENVPTNDAVKKHKYLR
jgi:hypothetical protein